MNENEARDRHRILARAALAMAQAAAGLPVLVPGAHYRVGAVGPLLEEQLLALVAVHGRPTSIRVEDDRGVTVVDLAVLSDPVDVRAHEIAAGHSLAFFAHQTDSVNAVMPGEQRVEVMVGDSALSLSLEEWQGLLEDYDVGERSMSIRSRGADHESEWVQVYVKPVGSVPRRIRGS